MGHYDKLAREIRELRREVRSGSQANQAAHTSIENSSIPVKDENGDVRLRIGAQDDGTHAVQYVQGPPPPRPTAPVVSVDGPVVRVRWDGTLLGGHIPEDFARIDVHFALASDDLEDQGAVKGNLATVAGNETVLAATQTGTYRVGLVAVSQSRARSEMSDTVEVDVTLVGMGDAIEAVADSANGKNKVTWSSEAPTPDDEGIAGDTWFVGEVGRPDDIIEAINLAVNPSFTSLRSMSGVGNITSGGGATLSIVDEWASSGETSLKISGGSQLWTAAYPFGSSQADLNQAVGKTYTVAADFYLPEQQTGGIDSNARELQITYRNSSNAEVARAFYAKAPNEPGEHRVAVTGSIPADARSWGIRIVNGSMVTPMYVDSITIEEGASASTYFDGDTPDGGSENESHYRWTGEPHQSTSEKYLPALDIGDDDKWNVTEQYQHTGTEWVRIELSHRVFSTVDLAKATVGYLNGQRIEAGTVDTPQLSFGAATGDILSTDALNFKTARGMEIVGSTFRAGDAVEITEDFGIRQFGPDGALNVSLPSDGSPAEFRGDLSARTLTATGRMSVQGPGAIAAGGVLELESGVVPPVAGPQLTNIWDRVDLPALEPNERARGVTFAAGHWWRFIDVESQVALARFEKITPAGELVDTFPFANQFWPWNGATSIGDELFVLGTKVGPGWSKRFVQVYSTSGTFKREWEYLSYGTGTYQPGIGSWGQNIVIAQCWASGEMSFRAYDPADGYQVSKHDTGDMFRAGVAGVYIGAADLGAVKVVVAKQSGGQGARQLTVFDSGSLYSYRPDMSWYSAGFEAPTGMVWDGTRFYTLHQDGSLYAYEPLVEGQFVGDDETDWWGAVAWASTDGTQVTPVGPATRFRYLRRSIIRRQNGEVPEGVERARFYLAKKSTPPAREDLHYVTHSDNPTMWSRVRRINDNWDTFATPVTNNTFITDNPGELRSAIGTFRVDGSGAGEWGPLAFHADGSMTGIPKVASGNALMTTQVANETSSMTVTLPVGMFQSTPVIVASSNTSVPFTTVRGVSVGNVTAESFNVYVNRTNTTNTQVAWIATGE